MYPLVDAYHASGLSQSAFCEAHAIPEPVVYYWCAKFRRCSSPTSDFVEIAPSASIGSAVLEIDFPYDVRLRFIVPAIDFSPIKKSIALCDRHAGLYACAALHLSDTGRRQTPILRR